MGAKEKLIGVQYLRAIAALMVVYYHLTIVIPSYTPYLAIRHGINTDYFTSAVPVFFVISGFVMYVSGIGSTPGRFAQRRLVRIIPLYWCLTLAVAALAVFLPTLLPHAGATPEHIVKSLLFIPYFVPGKHQVFPLLPPGWSLEYEMFFYGLFSLALFAPGRLRLVTVLSMLLGFYIVGLSLPGVKDNPLGAIYTSDFLLLFACGLMIGWLYRGGRLALPRWLGIILLLTGFSMLVGTFVPGWMRGDLAPASIVLGTVSLDAIGAVPRWTWFLLLGDASYSIYLAHPFALDALEKLWVHLRLHAAVPFAALAFAAAIWVALFTYYFIERPALYILNRRRRSMIHANGASGASFDAKNI